MTVEDHPDLRASDSERERTIDVLQAGDVAPACAPRVILTGGTVVGDVHVRARRLRERIADRLLGRGPRG